MQSARGRSAYCEKEPLRGEPKLAHFHINKPNVDMKHMKTGIQIIEKGQERKNLQNKKFAVPAFLVHSRTLCRERCLLTLFLVSVLFFFYKRSPNLKYSS